MKKDKYDLSKEELRRLRRKKEQQKAYAILALIFLCAILLGGAVGFGIYQIIKAHRTQPEVVVEEAVEEEPVVISEPEPEIVAEDILSDNSVSENTVSENLLPADDDISDARKAELLEEKVKEVVSGMTLEQKVAGLFFVTPDELTNKSKLTIAGSDLDAAMEQYPVGGIYITENNITDETQLQEFVSGINSFSEEEIFIGITECGGDESTLVKSGVVEEQEIDGAAALGEAADNTLAYTSGIAIGTLLKRYGFNTVIGPVADVAYSPNGYTAKNSFGSNPTLVKDLVRNEVNGIRDQQINTCVKFFPGYGDVTVNPASSRPTSSRTKEDIVEKDYPIYEDLIHAGTEFIMVSQVAYKPITIDVPACLSEDVVTTMLREELGYEGIIMTDYLDTHSIIMHYKHADMAVMAIEAGCDMIFCTGDFTKAYNGILDAVHSGKISEERINESLYRIYRVKYRDLIQY